MSDSRQTEYCPVLLSFLNLYVYNNKKKKHCLQMTDDLQFSVCLTEYINLVNESCFQHM